MRHATTLRPDEVHRHDPSTTAPQPADRRDVMQMEAATVGNEAFSGIVARQPGRFRPSVPPGVTSGAEMIARAPRGKSPYPERKKGKDDDGEKEEEKDDAGLLGVLSKVNTAVGAISALHEVWDKVFKSEDTKTNMPIPPMMTEEAQVDLNRALHYETSRLLCEYVFKKALFYDIDIKLLVKERRAKKKASAKDPGAIDPAGKGTGAKAPAGKAPAPPKPAPKADDEPNFAALEKDLEGLNELAVGDLKQQAIKIIAQRKRATDLRPNHFWWNHENDWGTYPSEPKDVRNPGFWEMGPVVLNYGVVTVRPRMGHLDGPVTAGLHPDVDYFNIPVIGAGQVNPRWWLGGDVEGKKHGRDINGVTIDKVEPVPDQDKPMGLYDVKATFDWDESNTWLRFKLLATKDSALIMGYEREGTPDVGWVH